MYEISTIKNKTEKGIARSIVRIFFLVRKSMSRDLMH
jgi:hypothetical protein